MQIFRIVVTKIYQQIIRVFQEIIYPIIKWFMSLVISH